MPLLVQCPCGKSFRAEESLAGRQRPCPHCGQTVVLAGAQVSPWDIFVSYAAKDKLVADAVVATVEANGIRCWIAPRDIVPGSEWSQAIIEGIEKSRVLVLVFSQNANGSPQVLREVERAVHRGMPIVPFRLEDIPASKAMEYFISCHHWLDAFCPPLEEHLVKLQGTLQALLNGKAPTQPAPQQSMPEKPTASARSFFGRPRVVIALSALLVAAGLVAGVSYFQRRQADALAPVLEARAACEAELSKRVHKEFLPAENPKAWEKAKSLMKAAKAAEQEGRLTDALGLYHQVPPLLKEASLPRLKGLAFWLGYAGYSDWFYHNMDRDPGNFPTGYGWQLRNQCQELLGLDKRLIHELLKQPWSREREDILWTDFPKALKESWPNTVDAYWFGFHLAYVYQVIDYKHAGVKSRTEQPQFGDTFNKWLLWAVNRAYASGCPETIIDRLHQVKDEFNTPLAGGLGETKQTWDKLHQVMKDLVSLYLADPKMATAKVFRQPAAKSPKDHGSAIAKLARVSFLRFDLNKPKNPLVRVEFLTVPEANSDQPLANLKGLSSLEVLILDQREGITDAGAAHVKDLTNLRELRLNRTRITDKGLTHLKGLTRLTKLSLAESGGVTNKGLNHLSGMAELRELDVTKTQVDAQGIAQLKNSLPKLTVINRNAKE